MNENEKKLLAQARRCAVGWKEAYYEEFHCNDTEGPYDWIRNKFEDPGSFEAEIQVWRELAEGMWGKEVAIELYPLEIKDWETWGKFSTCEGCSGCGNDCESF